jgi:hypothetical protein
MARALHAVFVSGNVTILCKIVTILAEIPMGGGIRGKEAANVLCGDATPRSRTTVNLCPISIVPSAFINSRWKDCIVKG